MVQKRSVMFYDFAQNFNVRLFCGVNSAVALPSPFEVPHEGQLLNGHTSLFMTWFMKSESGLLLRLVKYGRYG